MWRSSTTLQWIAHAGLLMLIATQTAAEQDGMSIGLTAEYTSGDYGTANTTQIWYFPLTIGYETSRTLFKLTIPYLIVQGTGDVVITPGGHHVIKSASTRTKTESGPGDVLISGSYTLLSETPGRPMLDLTAKFKLATADEDKNLGTGENDLALQLDLSKRLRKLTLYAGIGKKSLGDPPGIELNDILYAYIGSEHLSGDRNIIGVVFDYGEATTSTGAQTSELTFYLTQRLSGKKKLQYYLLTGLSDSSPDWGAGVGMTYYDW